MEPRNFSEQFRECKAANLVKTGDFISFEGHPDMMPAFPSPEMTKAIKSGEWKGIQLLACGKFGGRCSSGNPGCRKLRGLLPKL